MKDTLSGVDLVALWREGEQESPAGPLFAAGVFAEADITIVECGTISCGTWCSGSQTRYCC
jgi:hypothetical protein